MVNNYPWTASNSTVELSKGSHGMYQSPILTTPRYDTVESNVWPIPPPPERPPVPGVKGKLLEVTVAGWGDERYTESYLLCKAIKILVFSSLGFTNSGFLKQARS